MTDVKASSPKLHEIAPRENVGRDTIARYQCQFKAAAYECLSLLEDDVLDRVYCDYQDDYVSRFNADGEFVYHFYQVKTKSKLNYQWSVRDIFGVNKRAIKTADPKIIENSFAGKLLIHTIKFNTACGKVILLTNIHFDDDVVAFMEAAKTGKEDNNHYKLVIENFNEAFCSDEPIENEDVIKLIKKLDLKANISYLTPHDDGFYALARDTIYKFSEIDLHHEECEEILNNLVALVQQKSLNKLISDIDESDLDEIAGIGLFEMLDILSISKGAYKKLKEGGDSQAIKSASIIHRLLSDSGATESMIEFASGCKVKWDIWYRDKRHSMAEFDLNFIQEAISKIASDWASNKNPIKTIQNEIEVLFYEINQNEISSMLSKELLLGAVFSAVVRNEA